MKKLCQFIYLDEYKVYSLYSQVFEGFTDHVVRYSETEAIDEERQRGPAGSGRFLMDLTSEKTGQQEKRFLHDYAFTLFEKELESQQKVCKYDLTASEKDFNTLTPGLIVRVKGAAIFNDIKAICNLIEKFNKFGEAVTYVTTHGDRVEEQKFVEQKLGQEKDRNRRAKIKASAKSLNNIQRLAKEAGLRLDDGYLENLKYLLDYGYSDHFELQIYPFVQQSDCPFFSALLKRDCLREDDSLLVKKYSRQAQGEFYLLGIVCQGPEVGRVESSENSEPIAPNEDSEPQHLRRAIVDNVVSALKSLEDSFTGRLSNEIILDPLAVYREV